MKKSKTIIIRRDFRQERINRVNLACFRIFLSGVRFGIDIERASNRKENKSESRKRPRE
jgi:hypothetical protein